MMASSRAMPIAILVLVLLAFATLASPAVPAEPDEASFTAERWPVPVAVPVDIVPLPGDGYLVASQTDGRIVRIDGDGAGLANVMTVPSQRPTGEYGLLGMTLHPDYPATPFVYVFYTEEQTVAAPLTQVVARFTYLPGDALGNDLETVLTVTAGPACCHNGGRVAFGPDGMLYASIGEHFVAPLAQAPYLPPGSILRYDAEGNVPLDNPYPGSPVAVSGLRNPFGLTFDDEWGMVVTDNGPSGLDGPGGLDEVNLLQVGDNAGWPLMRGDTTAPPFVGPLWHSGNAHIAPTGVIVPRGSAVPEWDGKILFCNFNPGDALIIDPAAADPVPTVAFDACHYSVAQDHDGRILFGTNGAIWVVS